jgi:hypothetical protein
MRLYGFNVHGTLHDIQENTHVNQIYWEPVTVRKTPDFTLAVLVPFGISDVYIGFTR